MAFTLGGTAGPGTKARFGKGAILIVHADGTARLWDVNSRQESLRFTATDGKMADIAFLSVGSDKRNRTVAVVTINSEGYIQGWTSKRNPARVKALINSLRSE